MKPIVRETHPLTQSNSIPKDAETVLIYGQIYKVIRLKQVRTIKPKKIVKRGANAQEKRIIEASPEKQRLMVRAVLETKRKDALKKELEVRTLNKALREKHQSKLTVSENDVESYLGLVLQKA
ncbi:hypothetical protein [Synechococcus sp. WH 8016]|uniref:hypothetical protein n=1 Tax=Synechococcus sp. WH 8016 TaxID=166318 RepID=UPI00022DA18F|nr:hypothetical protein [Synechococcus sp. WH 8016]EHA64081.1 hypothetical protein Syn8016DRAFT_1123 [Synechococcus sp. WH 8016]